VRHHTSIAPHSTELAPASIGGPTGRVRRPVCRRRTVDLLAPLKQDLAEWRLASRRPDDQAFLFPGATPQRPRRDHDYRNWRKLHFRAAAQDASVRQINAARQRDPKRTPPTKNATSRDRKIALPNQSRHPDSNRGPLHYE
jgi:hypothetical protein